MWERTLLSIQTEKDTAELKEAARQIVQEVERIVNMKAMELFLPTVRYNTQALLEEVSVQLQTKL